MSENQELEMLKNKVTIEEAGACKKKIIVEIPEETIKNVTDKQYKELGSDAVVPGFRKGRAPRRLLEKRFGKEIIEQVKLKLLSEAGDSAVKDNQIDVLREPDIDFEKIELPAEGPLKFDFDVEVRPEFDLPELEGIAIERRKQEVTKEQINEEIKQLQKWSGLWAPRKDGAAKLDDQIIAEVILKIEGVEEEEKLSNIEIHVKPNSFIGAIPVEKLDELLVGVKISDTKQINIEVPKTHFKKEYRGKKVDIQITIKEIKSLEPAELNEDLFKKIGVKDKKELQDKINDTLQMRLEQQSKTEMTEQIYKYLLDNTNFELPSDIIAEQSASLLQRQYSNLLMRGLSSEQVEEQMEQLRAGSEQQAKEQLETFFMMDKIANKLNIEVSEEEVNGHIAQLAIQRGQRPEKMREEMVRDGSLAQFRLQVRENKCTAKLLESAKITEVKPGKKVKSPKKTTKKSDGTKKKQSRKPKTTAKTKKKTDE